jgi:hypothetical protein
MIVEDTETLKNLWLWLDYCTVLTEKEQSVVTSVGTLKFPGVRAALRIDTAPDAPSGSLKSDLVNNNSFDLQKNKTYRYTVIF